MDGRNNSIAPPSRAVKSTNDDKNKAAVVDKASGQGTSSKEAKKPKHVWKPVTKIYEKCLKSI